MKTAMQELIEWCKEHAYWETPSGQKEYVAIDYNLLSGKFDEWKEMEKQQIINAHLSGQNSESENDGMGQNEIEYFNQTYNEQ